MRLFSIIVGFIAGVAMACVGFVSFADPSEPTTKLSVLGDLTLIACLAIATCIIVHAVCLALCVLMVRGRFAIAWVPVRDCTSFRTWLSSDWYYFGLGGRNEGIRLCGLEIAVQGILL